jgi:hypothetical protein
MRLISRLVVPVMCVCLLQIGWSKVQELRRYIKLFRDSGKYTICYMKVGWGLEHCGVGGNMVMDGAQGSVCPAVSSPPPLYLLLWPGMLIAA